MAENEQTTKVNPFFEHARRTVNATLKTLREVERNGTGNFAGLARGISGKMVRLEITETLINTKSGVNEKNQTPYTNSYLVGIGTAHVARNPQTGFWYTKLAAEIPALLVPRQDYRGVSFFQRLAEMRRNQEMHKSLISRKFKGTVDVNAHSVSVVRFPDADGSYTECLVIEADAVYGSKKSWTVMDHPMASRITDAIDSYRKPADEAPAESPEPTPADAEMAEALA